jgi:hypothetical protein
MYPPLPAACIAAPPATGIRLQVVYRLQQKYFGLTPGSPFRDVLDLAMSLALSPRRAATDPERLYAGAIRDAEKLIRRRARRCVVDPLDGDTGLSRAIRAGRISGAAIHVGPEHLMAAVSLRAGIRARVMSNLGRNGLRCLDALLADEPVVITAVGLELPLRTLERLRADVRREARAFLDEQ